MPSDRLTAEVYSFLNWIASIFCAVVWLIWTFVPDSVLHGFGLTYYPDKWWAVALPMHLVVTLAFVMFAYNMINMTLSLPPDDIKMIKDNMLQTTPEVYTVPGTAPEILYVDIKTINDLLFGGRETPPAAATKETAR